MGIRRASKPITDSDLPASIARDVETTAAITSHLAATDPHPTYLTQVEAICATFGEYLRFFPSIFPL